MKRAGWSGVLTALVWVGGLLLPGAVADQDPQVQDLPADSSVPSGELAASKTLRTRGMGTFVGEQFPEALWRDLIPQLSVQTMAWFAVVVILVLTLQTKRLLSWHNLDGLMLALTALLLALRANIGVGPGYPTEQAARWWTYLLLTLVGLYWVLRGLKLLMGKAAPARRPNVSEGAMVVLILAGLFIASSHVVQAPLSAGSRDGLIGGIYTAETGKLPYGDALGHDARSPLLYLLHAGMVKLVPPTYEPSVEPVLMVWEDRSAWLDEDAWETVDLKATRLVNALLFVLLFAALAGIGHRLHSVAMGQTLAAILCVFPGVLECLPRPEIMLPATLLAWSIACVSVRGVGGLLSVFLLVLAGLAWPWAWLALPALLAYFIPRGWQVLGAGLGLLGGAAAIIVGMTLLALPTVPRHDGALAAAGITPAYEARLSDDGTPVIEHHRVSEPVEPTFKSWAWKLLLERDQARLDSSTAQWALPNGVDATSVLYRDVIPTDELRAVLQRDYREALANEPPLTRTWAVLRTALEATWTPEERRVAPLTGVWDLWAASRSDSAGFWTVIRRSGKVVVGLLALLVAVVLIRGQRRQLHQLIGALLVVSAATLLISMTGAATNWVWLMPTALGALAAKAGPAAPLLKQPPQPTGKLPPFEHGPAPRITVEP